MRLVADAIRDKHVDAAFRMLEVTQKRAASVIQKTLKSAVANAVNNNNLDSKNLFVAQIVVNESQPLKRFRPSTRGRVHPYKKRGSHLTIILKEKQIAAVPTKAIEKKNEKQEGKEAKKEVKK